MSTKDAVDNSSNRKLLSVDHIGAFCNETAVNVPRIPNPKGYTGEQYAADLAVVVPGAFYDLQRCGFLTACAHCGGPQTGQGHAIHAYSQDGKCTDIRVVAICRSCLAGPILPAAEWRHVDDDSCLFHDDEYWWESVQTLRMFPILNGRYGPCLILGVG